MNWLEFRKKFECISELVALFIGVAVGAFLFITIHPLAGLFIGGAVVVSLWGEELN